ncbi:MAG TPA: hypothetical protein VMF63_05605, partial [Opitutaceae bacterium]|nr:hypothetical protein [Opitutaceae bacterium]
MRYLRIVVTSLVVAVILAVFLLAASISPTVQTWIAAYLLGDHGSVDEVSARFGHAEIDNLKMTFPNAVLTVPHLEADLPVTTAVRERRLLVKRLVVKDWTLDFTKHAAPADAAAAGETATPAAATGTPPPTSAPTDTAAAPVTPAHRAVAFARIATGTLLGALGRLHLPCDLAVDGVDLDGIVIVPVAEDGTAAHVHVKITGGGLAAGHEGTFTLDGTSDILETNFAVTTFAVKGQLFATLDTPRTFGRLAMKAAVSASGGVFGGGTAVTADLSAARSGAVETYTVDLTTGDERHLVKFTTAYTTGETSLAGTWETNLQDADVAQFLPGKTLPAFAVVGKGGFGADTALTHVSITGNLRGTASRIETLAPSLSHAGPVAFDASFDAEQADRTLHLARLEVAATSGRIAATARILQPTVVDLSSWVPMPATPANDWVEFTGRAVPTDWLPALPGGYTLSGGEAAGDVIVRQDQGTLAVRCVTPATAANVDLTRDGNTVARRLDLTVTASADSGPNGWHLQASPLQIARAGRPLAELGGTVSQAAAADAPIEFQGAWTAELGSAEFKAAFPVLGRVGGRSASGDVAGTAGDTIELNGKLKVAGRDAHHTLAAGVHATVDDSGRVEFTAPVKIAFGADASDLTIQGTLIRGTDTPALYLKVTGKSADVAHLRLLGGAAAALEGVRLPAAAEPGVVEARDASPFWGEWSGRVLLTVDQLRAGSLKLTSVDAGCTVDPHSIKIDGGHAKLGSHQIADLAGGLQYDGVAGVPYQLKVTFATDPIEIGPYFPGPVAGGDPAVEGKFDVAASLQGTGLNATDLRRQARATVRLSSTAGIVRVFKTDVDEALPAEKESAAGDAAGRVGLAVGKFFGAQDVVGTGRRKVTPATQAALDVINN